MSSTYGPPLHAVVLFNTLEPEKNPNRAKLVAGVFEHLLRAGAKASLSDSSGRTPMHVAASSDSPFLAELLIKAGSRISLRDERGRTPLDYAESGRMIKLLKTNGAVEN